MAAGQITLSLTVDGQIGKAPIGPFSSEYALTGQTGGMGPQQVTVAAAAGPASVDVPLANLQTQNLLLLCTDEKITYQLNSDGIDREIEASGFAVLPGAPVITELALGGNGSKDACVTVLQMGLAGAPSTVVGGALFSQEILPAANPGGNPAFVLNWEAPPAAPPAKPVRVFVYIDGALQAFTDYTVVGTTLTWTGAALAGTERLNFVA